MKAGLTSNEIHTNLINVHEDSSPSPGESVCEIARAIHISKEPSEEKSLDRWGQDLNSNDITETWIKNIIKCPNVWITNYFMAILNGATDLAAIFLKLRVHQLADDEKDTLEHTISRRIRSQEE